MPAILAILAFEVVSVSGAGIDNKVHDVAGEVPPPSGLTCNGTGSPSGVKSLLSVTSIVDPGLVDAVSFMVARADDLEQWPFLQYSVPVPSHGDGKIQAILPALTANTRYMLMARAHARGQATGWYKKWSKVVHHIGVCGTPEIVPDDSSAAAHGHSLSEKLLAKPRTRWVEMYRINGPTSFSPNTTVDPDNNYTLPDYLENHNAFPAPPTDPSLLAYWGQMNASVTRYCAELVEIDFDNVTTPGYIFGGGGGDVRPVRSQYADYLSCNGGQCRCMLCGDRVVFLNHKEMKEACPMTSQQERWVDAHYQPNATSIPEKQKEECLYGIPALPMRECSCPNLAQSLRYVGMAPGMFSFPLGGQCAFDEQIGDNGCTWKTGPLSFSLSLGNLMARGIFDPKKTMQERMTAALAAFEKLGAQTCGTDRASQRVTTVTALVV